MGLAKESLWVEREKVFKLNALSLVGLDKNFTLKNEGEFVALRVHEEGCRTVLMISNP